MSFSKSGVAVSINQYLAGYSASFWHSYNYVWNLTLDFSTLNIASSSFTCKYMNAKASTGIDIGHSTFSTSELTLASEKISIQDSTIDTNLLVLDSKEIALTNAEIKALKICVPAGATINCGEDCDKSRYESPIDECLNSWKTFADNSEV